MKNKINKMNIKKNILSAVILGSIFLPIITLAQIGGSPPAVNFNLTQLGQNIANAAWIVFTILAVIMFVFAGILFLTAQGSAEKVATARQAFLWGMVGVVVAILAFTIITLTTSIVNGGH